MTGLLNEDKDEKKILTHVNGAIGHVVFNNPQRHNAVSLEMWDMVEQALSTFASDETIRVVVLSGAGTSLLSQEQIFQNSKKNAALRKRRYNARIKVCL